jgi:hypothetical protein
MAPGTLDELRLLYQVPLRQLIAAARQGGADDDRGDVDGFPMTRFDFAGLKGASTAEARLVAELVATIQSQRGAVRPSDGAIAIRRRDLRALSDLLEIAFDDFVQRLRDEGALRKPVGRPRRAGDLT